jgi:large subunit ribosomal protein L25
MPKSGIIPLMSDYKLSAKPRKIFGRKVKSLRRDGIIPANIFGKKTKSISIQLDGKTLVKMIREAGETSLIDLTVEGEKAPRAVLISGYAQNPVTDTLLHVDFHQVDLTKTTTATVPVSVVGESPAVAGGNTLVTLKNEIDVEALPADLPESIEVDISALTEVGNSILAKDLKLDRTKITMLLDEEETIVTIQAPVKEEVIVEEESVEGEEGTEGEEGEAKEGEAEEGKDAKGEDKPEGEKKDAKKD